MVKINFGMLQSIDAMDVVTKANSCELINIKIGILKVPLSHKQVYDRNYICLLHSYGNLCSCLHKCFFIFVLSMYN